MHDLDSTTVSGTAKPAKPDKPWPTFPLYAHKSGRWAKKIRGTTHYFGPWRDPNGAHQRYLADKDDLEAGRRPSRASTGVTDALAVKQMVGLFLDSKEISVESGEMEKSTWKAYERLGKRVIHVFGANTVVESLGPDDFQRLRKDIQKTHKRLESITTAIAKIKAIFHWAANDQGYIDRLPRFGSSFKRPSKPDLDREREERGGRVFAAEQIRALVAAARPTLKAMILLGVNCGYGNTDCGKLPLSKLDLDGGWTTFARTKNAIRRRAKLWPETVEAIREVLKGRKAPADSQHAGRVFITKYRHQFRASAIGYEFEKLALKTGMTREAADFYDLRRTCASIGIQCNDDDAVRTIMGHKRVATDMLGVYNRLQVSDERLQAISEHIRAWLLPAKPKGKPKPEGKRKGKGKAPTASISVAAAAVQPAVPSEPAVSPTAAV